jgi:hypothetical protein
MKEKKMYLLIIGIFILFYPELTIANQKSDCSVVKVEQLSAVYQNISLLQDIEDDDFKTCNSESQNCILRLQIPGHFKTLHFHKFNNTYFLNKKNQNQICISFAQNFVPNYHIFVLFTGMLLI